MDVIMELYEKVEQEKDNSSEYTLILQEFNELRQKFDSNINEEQRKELEISILQEQIEKKKAADPELKYHEDNEEFLKNITEEIRMIMGVTI